MDNTTTAVRLQEWSAAISECNNSGLSKREWCRQNGISTKTYYYRQRKVRLAAYGVMAGAVRSGENIQFEEITPCIPAPVVQRKHSSKAPAVLYVGNLKIELNETISGTMLKELLGAVRDAT